MNETKFKKIEAVLRHFLSLHEADAVYDMIFSPSEVENPYSEDDVIEYIKWCRKRYLKDQDTEFNHWLIECGRVCCGKPGTVIHATLRNEDLIPAFREELGRLDRRRLFEFDKQNPDALKACTAIRNGEPTDWFSSEDAQWVLDDLMDLLDEYAPHGHVFTVHPGDGSDFGYWPLELFL